MYNRDAMAELKESLGNLSSVMNQLLGVVSKDETSKGILELLKEKAGVGKEVKEVPATSGERADAIYPSVSKRQTNQPGSSRSSGEFDLNYWQMSRLRTAFQALTGDMGAFQRTVLNTIVWANKASRVNASATGNATAQVMEQASPIKTYKQAENWLMDKLIKEKGLGPGVQAFLDKTTPSGDKMLELLRAGVPVPMAQKMAQKINQDEILKEAQAATKSYVPAVGKAAAARAAAGATGHMLPAQFGGAGGGGLVNGLASGAAGGAAGSMFSWSGLAAIGSGIAVGMAPVIFNKVVDTLKDENIKNIRSQYGTLNADIATGLAKYDVAKFQLNLREAEKLADSSTEFLKTAEKFDKSMEPLYTGAKKIWNKTLTGAMNTGIWINDRLDDLGSAFEFFFADNFIMRNAKKRAQQEMPFDPSNLPILGGVAGGVDFLKKIAGLPALVRSTPPGLLASDIANQPLASPKRFVP